MFRVLIKASKQVRSSASGGGKVVTEHCNELANAYSNLSKKHSFACFSTQYQKLFRRRDGA